jgi:hypothetical protein
MILQSTLQSYHLGRTHLEGGPRNDKLTSGRGVRLGLTQHSLRVVSGGEWLDMELKATEYQTFEMLNLVICECISIIESTLALL